MPRTFARQPLKIVLRLVFSAVTRTDRELGNDSGIPGASVIPCNRIIAVLIMRFQDMARSESSHSQLFLPDHMCLFAISTRERKSCLCRQLFVDAEYVLLIRDLEERRVS